MQNMHQMVEEFFRGANFFLALYAMSMPQVEKLRKNGLSLLYLAVPLTTNIIT